LGARTTFAGGRAATAKGRRKGENEGRAPETARWQAATDADFEPSDEELAGLMKRAFAGIKEAERARLAKLRSDVAKAREEALARFERTGR
jgi:hypothetical protein